MAVRVGAAVHAGESFLLLVAKPGEACMYKRLRGGCGGYLHSKPETFPFFNMPHIAIFCQTDGDLGTCGVCTATALQDTRCRCHVGHNLGTTLWEQSPLRHTLMSPGYAYCDICPEFLYVSIPQAGPNSSCIYIWGKEPGYGWFIKQVSKPES